MSSFHQQIFEMFMESQYWAPEKMLNFQHGQLAQLLNHARKNVAFYKTRLDGVFKSTGEIDWDKWNTIPIVKRSDLANYKNNMIAIELPPGHGPTKEVYSSGSSGTPISVTHSHLAIWASQMALFRSHTWHGIDWSRNSVELHIGEGDKADWPHGWNKGPRGPDWFSEQQRGIKFELDRTTHEEKIIEFLSRNKIAYVSSRPTVLQALALSVERLRADVKLDAVFAFGGNVTETAHEDIKRALGTPVVSLYSSGEGYKIATTCDASPQYHINSELNFLEILDDDGKPCAIGEPGRVIITPLFNTAQPLIRYEQGDIAVRGAHCSCGKTLPVLQSITGRINDLFHFPDGKKLAAFLPDKEFTLGFGVNTWQLVQTSPTNVEVRFVQTDPKAEVNEEFAREMIWKKLRSDLNVKFVRLAKIPLTPAGKFIQYKSELNRTN
jgi:phenylacetate-CoA ligase